MEKIEKHLHRAVLNELALNRIKLMKIHFIDGNERIGFASKNKEGDFIISDEKEGWTKCFNLSEVVELYII